MSSSNITSGSQHWESNENVSSPDAATETPENLANAALLKELSQTLKTKTKQSSFAIGGFVPIVDPDNVTFRSPTSSEVDSNIGSLQSEAEGTTSHQITLRWDSENDDGQPTVGRVDFPVSHEQQHRLGRLVSDCQPATFGRGNKDVFDESYRRARKLDETAFSTNFSPYTLGIIDTVSKILLPAISGAKVARTVRAELYKLNIYSGPSGKFKAHVDTPRSNSQFGSLVVCLPCSHEGGQLAVRHAGESVHFDWSVEKAANAIAWAAFYSDCEHEVLEVTKGHRITLTYNLYVTSIDIPRGLSALDPKTLPLYTKLENLLTRSDFMPDGGALGLYCAHSYAHTSDAMTQCFPWILKGVDITAYQALKAAGLEVMVRPVIRPLITHMDDEHDIAEYIEQGLHLDWNESLWGRFCDWIKESTVEERQVPGRRHPIDRKQLVPATQEDIDARDDVLAWFDTMIKTEGTSVVAQSFGPIATTSFGGNEHDAVNNFFELYRDGFEKIDIMPIRWLNKKQHQEPALVHLTYGNEVAMETVYTAVALIFHIPSFQERHQA